MPTSWSAIARTTYLPLCDRLKCFLASTSIGFPFLFITSWASFSTPKYSFKRYPAISSCFLSVSLLCFWYFSTYLCAICERIHSSLLDIFSISAIMILPLVIYCPIFSIYFFRECHQHFCRETHNPHLIYTYSKIFSLSRNLIFLQEKNSAFALLLIPVYIPCTFKTTYS